MLFVQICHRGIPRVVSCQNIAALQGIVHPPIRLKCRVLRLEAEILPGTLVQKVPIEVLEEAHKDGEPPVLF